MAGILSVWVYRLISPLFSVSELCFPRSEKNYFLLKLCVARCLSCALRSPSNGGSTWGWSSSVITLAQGLISISTAVWFFSPPPPSSAHTTPMDTAQVKKKTRSRTCITWHHFYTVHRGVCVCVCVCQCLLRGGVQGIVMHGDLLAHGTVLWSFCMSFRG